MLEKVCGIQSIAYLQYHFCFNMHKLFSRAYTKANNTSEAQFFMIIRAKLFKYP
jgi:hypothetical protein